MLVILSNLLKILISFSTTGKCGNRTHNVLVEDICQLLLS